MNLFYQTFGNGMPLFILHGLFGSSDNWVTLGKKFAENYRVVLVDMRNHGRSPQSDSWNYPVMAEDIYRLAANLGFNNINLIGHSMGGKVGMTLAGERPGFLNKLVVADIAPRYYPIRHRNIIDGLLSISLQQIKSRNEADVKLANYIQNPGIRGFLLKNLEKDSKGGFNWKLNLEVINNHIENVGEATIPSNKISTPSLFIRGINSDYITDEDIMEIRKYYANSIVESIGNAGHWLHAEQPEAFMNTINEFLDE
ncbi:MAG: alpha/beta fold hydrolase [Cyclobacteriaceae bacterium]|nr:alpha/beta fold hydrolase [Cyclobacteriaceae bacterium]